MNTIEKRTLASNLKAIDKVNKKLLIKTMKEVGYSNKEIADTLSIPESSVHVWLCEIFSGKEIDKK